MFCVLLVATGPPPEIMNDPLFGKGRINEVRDCSQTLLGGLMQELKIIMNIFGPSPHYGLTP